MMSLHASSLRWRQTFVRDSAAWFDARRPWAIKRDAIDVWAQVGFGAADPRSGARRSFFGGRAEASRDKSGAGGGDEVDRA